MVFKMLKNSVYKAICGFLVLLQEIFISCRAKITTPPTPDYKIFNPSPNLGVAISLGGHINFIQEFQSIMTFFSLKK